MSSALAHEDDRGGFEGSTIGPCMECGEPTNRVDICFEAHLHYDCAPLADRKYWNAVRLPPGFALSADGMTLTWRLPCLLDGKQAFNNGKVSWDHIPTDDEFRYAIENASTLDSTARMVGQGNKISRVVGRLFLYHCWGPPVWWLPRPILSFRKREVGFGWLTHGFIFYLDRARGREGLSE